MVDKIKTWIYEAANCIQTNIHEEVQITEKSDRTDLVTTIDVAVQDLLIKRIKQEYPEDQILAEENGYSVIQSLNGRVWVIDPIDGTMNFVMEKENFCIMVAVFEEGEGVLGFIYNVMADCLYWGGSSQGVFCNQKRLSRPMDKGLSEGLVGMNAYMYAEDIYSAKKIGRASLGVRISGCAGIEFIAMLKGSHIGYISQLSPWDYAAGIVLLEEFGYSYSTIEGKSLNFADREYFIAATPKLYKQVMNDYLI